MKPGPPPVLDAVDEQLIARLAGRAREGGLALTGEGGLLAQLTKRFVESALEGEITDHLGYDRVGAENRVTASDQRLRCSPTSQSRLAGRQQDRSPWAFDSRT